MIDFFGHAMLSATNGQHSVDQMKNCMKCGIKKPLAEYYKHPRMADGHLNKCKGCTKNDVKRNRDKVGCKYDSTEHGVIRVIYKTQKRHQRLRGHGDLCYTRQELDSWMYENGYKGMYDHWVASGYKTDEKPSVDRIDSTRGYSFDNIRLVTWKKNRALAYQDLKNGKGSNGRRCKKVVKMDSNGRAVCEYVSLASAARDIGYCVWYQAKSGTKCRRGFYWRYK